MIKDTNSLKEKVRMNEEQINSLSIKNKRAKNLINKIIESKQNDLKEIVSRRDKYNNARDTLMYSMIDGLREAEESNITLLNCIKEELE